MKMPKYSKDSRLKSLILLAISLISSSRFDRRAFTIKYCFMSLSLSRLPLIYLEK